MIHVHFSSAFKSEIGSRDISFDEKLSTLGDLFALLSTKFPQWGEDVSIDDGIPDYNLLMVVNGQLAWMHHYYIMTGWNFTCY